MRGCTTSQNMQNKFKTIGIIGGMGSLATAALFQKVLHYSGALTDADYPRVLIDNNSAVPDRTLALVANGSSPVPAITASGRGLVAMGAKVLGMPCNTAHAFYADIQSSLSIPLVDMVRETIITIRSDYSAATRVGILCTTGTRVSGLYDKALADAGLIPINVDDATQELVMRSIYGEKGIKSGNVETPRRLLSEAINNLRAQDADVIVLACTELSLALSPYATNVPLMDTTDVLAKALIREARILV